MKDNQEKGCMPPDDIFDSPPLVQPKSYTEAELSKLREFVEVLKKDEARSALACWGNYSDYNHGY